MLLKIIYRELAFSIRVTIAATTTRAPLTITKKRVDIRKYCPQVVCQSEHSIENFIEVISRLMELEVDEGGNTHLLVKEDTSVSGGPKSHPFDPFLCPVIGGIKL